MKRILPFLLMIVVCGTAVAQGTVPVKDVLPAAPEWKVKSYELFAVTYPPDTTVMFNGTMIFGGDGKFSVTNMGNKTRTGTWSADAKSTWITLTYDDNKEVVKLKVISCLSNEVVIQYQDKELMKTKFLLVPNK